MTTPPTIEEGSTGPVVSWAQYRLVRLFLSDQQIDGIFGPVTKAAVEKFQSYRHLTVDGIVGPVTWAALGGDGPEPPTLEQGSDGQVVAKLQTALNEGRGDFAPGTNPVLVVDGIYGAHTATAVRGAQQLAASRSMASSGCRPGRSPCTRPDRCWPTSAVFPARVATEGTRLTQRTLPSGD